ncbi:MAG TPA: ComEC/Rec2 family competence protein [Bacteroidia bacterium]|nr:ComEC/Rec2 family competence protein [Bacteroidia bacterium]
MLCGFYIQVSLSLLFSFFIFLFVFACTIHFGNKSKKLVRVFGMLSLSGIFLLGWIFTLLKSENNYPFHFSSHPHVNGYLAVVSEAPKDKGNSMRCEARVISIKTDSGWVGSEGKILLYIRKDGLDSIPGYGDMILFRNRPQQVKGPLNPDQFNFQKWLSSHQVFHQLFLKQDQFVVAGHHEGSKLVEWAIALRERWVRVFQENAITGQEYAVLSALILGYDDEIDSDTMQAYAASGALHILSVSGMHLGIIYGALQALLSFLSRQKRMRIIKAILIILFLWFYALLTGLSPSVLRSAMMLSFIVIGQTLERSTNTYNTLGASMVALFILFSPHLILQAGFQLSYLAVAGILFLYKSIEDKFYFTSWTGRQAWGILSVSLAAQAATFPLSIFYFHQFPNYFLPSNLVVIPISTLVIFGGILLLLFSGWTFAAMKIAWLTGKLVGTLNASVSCVEQLPYSMITGIYVSLPELFLWYVLVLFLVMYFKEPKKYFLIPAGIALAGILACVILRTSDWKHQQKLVVYHIPGQSCIQFIAGQSAVSFVDSLRMHNDRSRKMACDGFEIKNGFRVETTRILGTLVSIPERLMENQLILKNSSALFGSLRVDILGNDVRGAPFISGAGFLIITQNKRMPRNFLQNYPECKKVILDGSNSIRTCKMWKRECEKLNVAYHATSENGAFVLDVE